MTTGWRVWKTCLHAGEDLLAERGELGPAVVDRRQAHRPQDPIGHVARTGDLQEVAAAGMLVEGNHGGLRSAQSFMPGEPCHGDFSMAATCERSRCIDNRVATTMTRRCRPLVDPRHRTRAARRSPGRRPERSRLRGACARETEARCCSTRARAAATRPTPRSTRSMPVGVFVPRTTTTCAPRSTSRASCSVPLLPRGAGTSPVRPDGRRRAGHRQQQAPAPGARVRRATR